MRPGSNHCLIAKLSKILIGTGWNGKISFDLYFFIFNYSVEESDLVSRGQTDVEALCQAMIFQLFPDIYTGLYAVCHY